MLGGASTSVSFSNMLIWLVTIISLFILYVSGVAKDMILCVIRLLIFALLLYFTMIAAIVFKNSLRTLEEIVF